MANRMKEDEKNEKIIRGLLKLPANKRCINCNSLGPQYVCTNFWTFLCTTCSGIHREFTHRVKSISMAKFTSQEVSALQGGGNQRAKEFYFKEWDPQRHSIPDSSNVERLRDFIKHVYVDRRYTGERSTDRPPRVKGDDTYRGDSRSPPYEDTYGSRYNERSGPGGRSDDRNSRYNYDEKRSPGYEQENRRYGDTYRKSPGSFEGADERSREERLGDGNQNRRFDEHRLSDGSSKLDVRSPNHQRDLDVSSPPVVRPVRDILGDDIPPLRVGDPPKSNGGRSTDASAHTRRTASSSSMGSADGNPVELKRVNSGSLIDFNTDPEPPALAVPQDPFSSQSVPQPTTSPSVDDGNWASFDFATMEKAPQAPLNAPLLASGLSQLASPAAPPGGNSTLSVGGFDSLVQPTSGGQWPVTQQQPPPPSLFNMPVSVAPNNQSWISSLAPNAQILVTAQTGHPSQVASKQSQETSQTTAGALSQPLPVEAKQTGRRVLPEDLFTAAPVPVPGWQAGPHQRMGFGMQYPAAMLQTFPAYTQLPKSTNPFDAINEPAHVPTFPSMASLQGALPNVIAPPSLQGALPNMGPPPLLQGALPNMAHPSLMSTSSFGNPSSQWIPPQPSSYPSALPQTAYMGQQAANSIPPLGQLGAGSFGGAGAAFGDFSANQRPAFGGSQPSPPNYFSSLGSNPFG